MLGGLTANLVLVLVFGVVPASKLFGLQRILYVGWVHCSRTTGWYILYVVPACKLVDNFVHLPSLAIYCICCPSLKTLRFCQLVMIIVCLPSLAARSSFSVRNSEEKGEEATQSSVSR